MCWIITYFGLCVYKYLNVSNCFVFGLLIFASNSKNNLFNIVKHGFVVHGIVSNLCNN